MASLKELPGSKLLAKFLALSPVRAAILTYAFRTPYTFLRAQKTSPQGEGELYMGRWVLFGTNPHEIHARVHHILRPDHDRDLHNHPFEYRTFVLAGWYDEVYLDAQGLERRRRIHAGQTSYSNGTFHRIAAVSPGGVWTVFVMGPDRGKWGFRVHRPIDDSKANQPGWVDLMGKQWRHYQFIESHAYFARRGNTGPQAEVEA